MRLNHPIKSASAIALICLAGACTQFPQLDNRVSPAVADAPPPALVPLGPLLARATPSDGADVLPAGLDERLAALRRRAAGLRAPVIPPAIRADMLRGVR